MAFTEEHREQWLQVLENLPRDDHPDPEDRLAVESCCSSFLASMWTRSSIPEVQGVSLAELEMVYIQFHLRQADAWSAAILAAMTELADAPGGRRAAAKAVERLRSLGVEPPRWYGEDLVFDDCWQAGDHFGDQRTYILSFKAPSGNYAYAYTVEFSEYHFDMAVACDATGEGPGPLLDLHRRRPDRVPGILFPPERCDPALAVRNTRRSLDDWDIFCVHGDPQRLDPSYMMLRELWKARLRLLPGVPSYEYERPDDDELSMFASGFVNYWLTERRAVLDVPALEAVKEMAWFHSFTRPRVSPGRSFVFLERYMPANYAPGDPVVDAVKRLFLPFVQWAAAVNDLSPEASLFLKLRTERLLQSFPDWKERDPDVGRNPRPRVF